MRSGWISSSRFTSSRSPSSSLQTLKRSPLGRTATSSLSFETSTPTLLTMTFVLLDDGFSLPCVASTFWLLQVSGLFRRLPCSDPCSVTGLVALRTSGLLHGRFLPAASRLPQVSRAFGRFAAPLVRAPDFPGARCFIQGPNAGGEEALFFGRSPCLSCAARVPPVADSTIQVR